MIDLRIISLVAGVQSSTLYRRAALGELTPRPDLAIFADTQCEPSWVYDTLDSLDRDHGHLIPIRRPSLGNLQTAVEKGVNSTAGRFAAVPFWVAGKDARAALGRRQCTREYKIDVVKRQIRLELGLEKGERAAGRYTVEEWVGISLDEVQRAKPSRTSWIKTRWPLLEEPPFRRRDCERWLKEHSFPIPGKSACIFCPYRRDMEYATWRDEKPELFEEACKVDDLIRSKGTMKGMRGQQYVSRLLIPLREIPSRDELEGKDDSQLDLFTNECFGMCGT